MDLYLSRLCLNPLFAPALKLSADPYELHRKLLATLPCAPKPKPATKDQPKTADLLFRVDAADAGPVVLLQSGHEPDWDALELAPRALRCPPQIKPYHVGSVRGCRLAFRLLCQPAIRKSGRFGLKANGRRVAGPRRACRTDEERLAWLERKAMDCGFGVETVGLTLVEWGNTKPLQAKGGSRTETNEAARKRVFEGGQFLGAVRFDGVLVVDDPEKLCQAVCNGIGPGKAFGFGLLSLAPAG